MNKNRFLVLSIGALLSTVSMISKEGDCISYTLSYTTYALIIPDFGRTHCCFPHRLVLLVRIGMRIHGKRQNRRSVTHDGLHYRRRNFSSFIINEMAKCSRSWKRIRGSPDSLTTAQIPWKDGRLCEEVCPVRTQNHQYSTQIAGSHSLDNDLLLCSQRFKW